MSATPADGLRTLEQWPEACTWVDAALEYLDLEVVGAPETVKLRPWSTVARLAVKTRNGRPAGDGLSMVWFKANGPGSRFEPALVSDLASVVPQWTVTPLTVQTDHAWSLSADGGPSLAATAGVGLAAWESFVTAMAHLQVAVADRAEALVAASEGPPSADSDQA